MYLFNNEIGIKRSIAVDKYGNILGIDITSSNEHDSESDKRAFK